MAKYLQRSCPKCNGYLGIVVPERKAKMPVQAINGRCLKMWLSACVGCGSWEDDDTLPPNIFVAIPTVAAVYRIERLVFLVCLHCFCSAFPLSCIFSPASFRLSPAFSMARPVCSLAFSIDSSRALPALSTSDLQETKGREKK